MVLYFAGSVAISLVLFITLALFFRKALRGLWKDHELLKKSLVDFQNNSFDRYRKLYGELQALLKMGSAVPFRAQHGEDIILWNFLKKRVRFFIEVGALTVIKTAIHMHLKTGVEGLIEAGLNNIKSALQTARE